jgi:hypothetical protein
VGLCARAEGEAGAEGDGPWASMAA